MSQFRNVVSEGKGVGPIGSVQVSAVMEPTVMLRSRKWARSEVSSFIFTLTPFLPTVATTCKCQLYIEGWAT